MKLSDVITVLEVLAPLRYAESWDNVGLLVGDPEASIARVLVTVDYTEAVAREARAWNAELVVAYHPPLFAPVKRVAHEALWADAVRRGIALYSPHTALDVAASGTNDFLADACGIERGAARAPIRAITARSGIEEPSGIGLGRIGPIAPATLEEIVLRLKSALGLASVLIAGDRAKPIARVAVAAGAGGELLGEALRARADLFVTGELRHHDALGALREGASVIATLHSNSERAAIHAHAESIAARLPGIDVRASTVDADPFVFA